MLQPGQVRRTGRLVAALAGLAVLAACGSVPSAAGGASAGSSPAAVGGASTGSSPAAVGGPSPGAGMKHFDFLNGVSCASPANCTAVGQYYRTAGGPQLTLVERWNGRAWRSEPSPSIGRGSTLDSVACPSPTRCTAVGSLVIGWNGVSWKVELRSSPFVSVSCAAPGSCMAVGVTPGGTPESGYFDGTGWKLQPMPRPRHPAQNITLAGVSCAGPSFCLAVGDYSYGVGAMASPAARDKTFAERWNGSSWRVVPTVNVASWNQLTAVSCTSPRSCTAVGSSASRFALAERWDGSTWTIQRVPGANRAGSTQLTAVSCSSGSACMAVGTYNAGIAAIAESWNGVAWTLHVMPGPPQPQPFVQPAGLSCTGSAGPAECVAVGNDGRTLAEIWAGARWQITPTPSP